MLLGRPFVGTRIELGPPVVALHMVEIPPPAVWSTHGSLTQVATCLELISVLFIGIPAKELMDQGKDNVHLPSYTLGDKLLYGSIIFALAGAYWAAPPVYQF
ncbi:hypothetical protein VNO77_42109 [Canavalia gladiata]|uniref:Uncharacterized protein n=1 Tax=Canavalia gladiata TaxID=3824 RepID=A0AAN9K1W9_CANGL